MSRELNEKDYNIIEEYFRNGYNKSQAFEKYNSKENYKSKGAFQNSVYSFFKREKVKEFIDERMKIAIGEREELINELLSELKTNIFSRETDEKYTFAHKQKDIELLMKISGINQAPKFKSDIEEKEMTIEVNIIED